MLQRLVNPGARQGLVYIEAVMIIGGSVLCLLIACCIAFGNKLIAEWADLGSMISSANQSYSMTGIAVGHPQDLTHPTDVGSWTGSVFTDQLDFCDQSATCGVRTCVPPAQESPSP